MKRDVILPDDVQPLVFVYFVLIFSGGKYRKQLPVSCFICFFYISSFLSFQTRLIMKQLKLSYCKTFYDSFIGVESVFDTHLSRLNDICKHSFPHCRIEIYTTSEFHHLSCFPLHSTLYNTLNIGVQTSVESRPGNNLTGLNIIWQD